MSAKYILVSFPNPFLESLRKDVSSLVADVAADPTTVSVFRSPRFTTTTLDGLMQNAEDLGKLLDTGHSVASKVMDCLQGLEVSPTKASEYPSALKNSMEHYVGTFSWDSIRYRSDRPLLELIDLLRRELSAVDDNIKTRLAQYQSVRAKLASSEKLHHGNLITKSLPSLVDPSQLVLGSDLIETHLIVVPLSATSQFLGDYETLAPMVVPRSACQITQDPEYSLFAVSTFKRYSKDFLTACKEQKWIPRQPSPATGSLEGTEPNVDELRQDEKRARAEMVRLGASEWCEVVKIRMHTLSLLVFVEAVLQYGFPLDYQTHLIKTTPTTARKLKSLFDKLFHSAAKGAADKSESPYVYYEFAVV